jgi:cell division control protein 7
MQCLFRALAYVHSKKLVHGDVKPSNFFFNRPQMTGVLGDFGFVQVRI